MKRDLGEFSRRLRAQRPEIEGMVLARVYGVSDPASVSDHEYVAGLRSAVSVALDYGFAGIEGGETRAGPAPAALLAQARHAARSGVSLDIVVRRYIAGYALLGDFVIRAIEEGGSAVPAPHLRRIWRIQTTLLDRLIAAVVVEYKREVGDRLRNAEERRAERVKMLLTGQLLDPDELQYQFEAWHIGVVAHGPGAPIVIRNLARELDRRLLLVRPGGGTIWAWLGGQHKVAAKKAEHLAPVPWPSGVSLALGEPEQGLAGWRLTHRQARAAVPIALRPVPRMVRYADVTLLATALRDDVFASSLRRLYLDPLAHQRDGGAALRRTLRAYFAASRNISSAAAMLKVSRQTVHSRLNLIEDRIGRPIDSCAPEMDTALQMLDLGHSGVHVPGSDFE